MMVVVTVNYDDGHNDGYDVGPDDGREALHKISSL